MSNIGVDASSASEISQRYNVLVYSLYAVGVGRSGRSSFDLDIGLSGLMKVANETGVVLFSRYIAARQLKPHLERFQKMLNNQCYLVFHAVSQKESWFTAGQCPD